MKDKIQSEERYDLDNIEMEVIHAIGKCKNYEDGVQILQNVLKYWEENQKRDSQKLSPAFQLLDVLANYGYKEGVEALKEVQDHMELFHGGEQ